MFRLLSGNWQGGLCNSLHQLQQNGLLCDLVLNLADDKQVHAHSCVMAAASPYLRELIVANNPNSHLETLNSEAVQILISYMYSGEVSEGFSKFSCSVFEKFEDFINNFALNVCCDLLTL
jgi:hypothetical protein